MLRYDERLRTLALGFAMLAGFVDTIGFLMSGGLFVSFMSGNSTRLAIGFSETSSLVGQAAMLIALFVLGVVTNVVVCARVGAAQRKVTACAVVAVLLVASATLQSLAWPRGTVWAVCLAMGAANVVFQREGEVSIGVTYMTGNLVRLGYRIAYALLGQDRTAWLPYLLLWIAFVLGGIGGALTYRASAALCLWAAAAFAMVLVVVARVLTRPRYRSA